MFKEKRKYPRLSKELPLKIATKETDLVAQTTNLSCNGAYCSVGEPLPLMTKLQITLLLPPKDKNPAQKSTKIKCKGVIVRNKKNAVNNSYNIAIFFEQIREKERDKLEDYINHHINI